MSTAATTQYDSLISLLQTHFNKNANGVFDQLVLQAASDSEEVDPDKHLLFPNR